MNNDEQEGKAQPTLSQIAPHFANHRLARHKCAPSRFNKGVWIVRNNQNEPVGILHKVKQGYVIADEFGEQRTPAKKATALTKS